MTKQTDDEISLEARKRLMLEYSWLDASRVHFKASHDDYIQLAFADNANPEDAIDVIRQYTLLVEKGVTPPPHILIAIAKAFGKYIRQKPRESLDVVFNLKRKQRVGHPLDHRATREERGRFAYLMWSMRQEARQNGDTISIEEAAGEIINRLNLESRGISDDSLKKDYIALKADEVFGRAMEVILELATEKK
jgi:hypothetical protein